MTEGVELGTCAKCRGRTIVTPCKIEARAGDPHPVEAPLCASCIARSAIKVTRLRVGDEPRLTHLYNPRAFA